ncbi:septal ring lytic transglycosylase RlpA family protein [Zoogloea sp.]|uniref:septal ring lytic transglycosylase RlpA family protein n=1 Tax=Zoogloea sp. TaxID=49181 RepID=UPI00261D3F7A|nr:septal ring lytic transglycosylase RlpA family protein [Zoogloea sp.]MDD3353087.1 septal ring lytic transglycosylase RlpA family protein [Zoogloea sp.]
MPPVATLRRAAFRLAPLCSALLLAACASTPPVSLAEAADGQLLPFARTGLRSADPARVLASPFRFDRQDEDAADASDLLEAPRYEKEDYSLGSGVALGNSGSSFREKGAASWYGKAFHGKRTSSGEGFDMYAMTAAHPTLPIPSYVRVTNLANGRSAVVRINDRGPFHPGRIIDLSYAAAHKLGYAEKGHAQVELALILPEGVSVVEGRKVPPVRRARSTPPVALAQVPARTMPPAQATPAAPVVLATTTPPAPAETRRALAPLAGAAGNGGALVSAVPSLPRAEHQVFLQLGTFGSLGNAETFKSFVEHELKGLQESISVLAADGKYRLHLGPFPSVPDARSFAERIAVTLKLRPALIQR